MSSGAGPGHVSWAILMLLMRGGTYSVPALHSGILSACGPASAILERLQRRGGRRRAEGRIRSSLVTLERRGIVYRFATHPLRWRLQRSLSMHERWVVMALHEEGGELTVEEIAEVTETAPESVRLTLDLLSTACFVRQRTVREKAGRVTYWRLALHAPQPPALADR